METFGFLVGTKKSCVEGGRSWWCCIVYGGSGREWSNQEGEGWFTINAD